MTKFAYVLIFFTLLQYQAFAEPDIPNEVSKIASDFNTSMNNCPQKIWDDYSWNDFLVFLVYKSTEKAYLWNGSSNEISEYDFNQLPNSAKESSYEFFAVDGKKAMSLNMEEKQFPKFRLAIHEGFHFIGQNEWTSPNRGPRGTAYPLNYKPRYYRRMLFDKLSLALKRGQESDFQKAKYWFDLWADNFPDETKSTTDGYEGSAEYAETMAHAIVSHGCNASDDQLKKEVLTRVKEYSPYVAEGSLSLSTEGYAIGGLSSLLLRFTQSSTDWQTELASGSNPLNLLLENYSSLEDTDDLEIKSKYEAATLKKNVEIGELVDNDIMNFANSEYVRIGIPYEWNQTNFMPKFFITPTDIPNSSFSPLYTEHNFISATESSSIKLKENTVVISSYSDNPCHEQFILVHQDDISTSNPGEYTIQSDMVSATIIASEKQNLSGLTFLCPDKTK